MCHCSPLNLTTTLAITALNGFKIFLLKSFRVDTVPSLPMILWVVINDSQDPSLFYLCFLSHVSVGRGSRLLDDFVEEIVEDYLCVGKFCSQN